MMDTILERLLLKDELLQRTEIREHARNGEPYCGQLEPPCEREIPARRLWMGRVGTEKARRWQRLAQVRKVRLVLPFSSAEMQCGSLRGPHM